MKKKNLTKKLKDTSIFFDKKNKNIYFKGPLDTKQLKISCFKNKILFKAFFKQNLLRTLVPSIIRLHFIGVGFRVESLTEKVLSLKIGYSHLVHINIPKNIKVIVLKKINIILSSSNDQAVTEFASILRSHRFPDIFKGKGLLFKDEKILLKESKSK